MNKPIVFVIRSLPSSSLAVSSSSSASLATTSSPAFIPRRTICHSLSSPSSAPNSSLASSSSFSLSSSSSSTALPSTAACCGLNRSSCRCHPIYSTLSLNFSAKAVEKSEKSDAKPKVLVLDDATPQPLSTAENAFRQSLESERKANQELYEKRAAVARELSPNHPIATHNADGTRRSSDRLLALIDELLSLSITDLKLVIDGMSKKLGLEISAFNAAAAAPPPGAGAAAPAGGAAPAAAAAAKDAKPAAAAAPAADKKSFDVRLDKFADKDKIKVIKEVRTATGLGLKESKELVESVASGGKIVKKDLKKEEAEALLAKLKEAGAEASLV